MTTNKQYKRAAYSHSGCAHCKKVRQKCDEKKPSCTACLNQKQECVYLQHIVMWTPRQKKEPVNKGRSQPKQNSSTITASSNSDFSKPEKPASSINFALSSSESSDSATDNNTPTPDLDSRFRPQHQQFALATPSMVPIIQQDVPPQFSSSNSVRENPAIMPLQTAGFLSQVYPQGQGQTQAQAQPAVASQQQAPINAQPTQSSNPLSPSNFFSSPGSSSGSVARVEGGLSPESTDEDGPMLMQALYNIPQWNEYGVTEWKRIMRGYRPSSFLNENDMQKFMEYVFLRAKCGFNYPFGVDENNPLWKSIMRLTSQFDHLRYVVLSVATNILQYECRCSEWAPYRRKYMDNCMQSLIVNISSYTTNDEICTLFATVMILYSDRSASVGNKWRLHLRGALELLNARSPETPGTDDLFGVLRSWFSLAETYAWISSPCGGTVPLEQAMEILDDSKYAYQVEGLVIGGFNTFKCYGQSVIYYFAKAAFMTIAMKQKGQEPDHNECYELARGVESLVEEQMDLSTIANPSVRLAMIQSHKIHCLSLELYILHRLIKLPASAGVVQEVLGRVTPMIQSFPFSETLGVAIHWPVFMAGTVSIHIETRTIVETHLNEIVSIGLYVARNSLFRLHRYWELYDEDCPDIYSDDTDSIAF